MNMVAIAPGCDCVQGQLPACRHHYRPQSCWFFSPKNSINNAMNESKNNSRAVMCSSACVVVEGWWLDDGDRKELPTCDPHTKDKKTKIQRVNDGKLGPRRCHVGAEKLLGRLLRQVE